MHRSPVIMFQTPDLIYTEISENGPVRKLDPQGYYAKQLTGLELQQCIARCRLRDRDFSGLDELDLSEMCRYVVVARMRPFDAWECQLIIDTTQNCPKK